MSAAAAVDEARAVLTKARMDLAEVESELGGADPDGKAFAAGLARRTQLRERVDVLGERLEAARAAELEAAEREKLEARRAAEKELAPILAEIREADAALRQELLTLGERLYTHATRMRKLGVRAHDLVWRARGESRHSVASRAPSPPPGRAPPPA